ncbi:uncharacterized protein EI90DRAFT_3151313 [Cantharellus anzutake]|uniref:uncharacterized protein n=1 Tax=Cantharellus anzutake TaxID=1750568 RepID=UPI001908A3F0|nr:uncharacterized protein EI90DRAFT_3151313 [Cantharellus anzutake]KAF8339884.1 hypothetical protein EI90DRAFT_3151313 [Cantharellus anzutake]
MANPPPEPTLTQQANVPAEDDRDVFLACLKEFKELGQKLDRIITSAERQKPDRMILASAEPVSDIAHTSHSGPRNEDIQDIQDIQFKAFQREMARLSSAVTRIADTIKDLKSAYHLIRISEEFRSRLALVFRILPLIASPSSSAKLKKQWLDRPSSSLPMQYWTPAQVIRENIYLDETMTGTPDRETLSMGLQKLGQGVDVFNAALKGLPGFHDIPGYNAKEINLSLRNFAQDLKYWGRNLDNFHGQTLSHHLRAHVATIQAKIADHLAGITGALEIFIHLGLPIVLRSERDSTFQNLSTVAALFASVSATTIQFSYTQAGTRVEQAVNVLWIVSLVFAIASATNSQLSYQWTSVVFSTPMSALSWWGSLWIRRMPLIFLVLSVISFSVGIVCFTFSNFGNHPIIPVCVTAASAVSAVALFYVGLRFIAEYFAFRSRKKTGDELDYLSGSAGDLASDWVLKALRRAYQSAALWCSKYQEWFLLIIGITVFPITFFIIFCLFLCEKYGIETDEIWEHICDWFRRIKNLAQNWRQQRLTRRRSILPTTSDTPIWRSAMETRLRDNDQPPSNVGGNDAEAHAVAQLNLNIKTIHRSLELGDGPSTPIQKFRSAVIKVIMENRCARAELKKKHKKEEMDSMKLALGFLSPVQSSREHTTMIHDINFRYDGRYLATFSAHEKKVFIWETNQMEVKVIERVDLRRRSDLPSGDHMEAIQVMLLRENRVVIIKGSWLKRLWLLRRLLRLLALLRLLRLQRFQPILELSLFNLFHRLLRHAGLRLQLILGPRRLQGLHRVGAIKCINWVPEVGRNEAGRNEGTRLPFAGDLDYALEDAVLTRDGTKLLGIATVLSAMADKDYPKPSKSPSECRIIIYDVETKKTVFEIPTFDSIRRMSLSYSSKRLLVMSDGSTPPRLFLVYPTWLVPLHTFDLPDETEYPIYGQFGIRSPAPVADESEEDQIIICANKRGKVFIWHRESYRLLHSFTISIPGNAEVSGVTFGCERMPAHSYLRVAAACTDGTVIMWSTKWDHPDYPVLTDVFSGASEEATGGTIEEVAEGAGASVAETTVREV